MFRINSISKSASSESWQLPCRQSHRWGASWRHARRPGRGGVGECGGWDWAGPRWRARGTHWCSGRCCSSSPPRLSPLTLTIAGLPPSLPCCPCGYPRTELSSWTAAAAAAPGSMWRKLLSLMTRQWYLLLLCATTLCNHNPHSQAPLLLLLGRLLLYGM